MKSKNTNPVETH